MTAKTDQRMREAGGCAAQERYQASPHGRAVIRAYRSSPERREAKRISQQRHRASPEGKAALARYAATLAERRRACQRTAGTSHAARAGRLQRAPYGFPEVEIGPI